MFDVTGVNIRTSEATLSGADFFGQFGDIKRIRFIYRQTSQPGESKFTGKCVVFYQSYVELDPNEVIEVLNGRMVDQRMIRVKLSSRSKKSNYKNYNQLGHQYYPPVQYYDHRHTQPQALHPHYRNQYNQYPSHAHHQHHPAHRPHRSMHHQFGFDSHLKRQAYYEERYGFGFNKNDYRYEVDRYKQSRAYPVQTYH